MALPQRLPDRPLEHSTDEIRRRYPEFTKRLLDRQAEIIGRTQEARHNLDEQLIDSPGDAADVSVVDTSADYFLNLANSHQRELLEIQAALDRMRRGVYGTCENCENPIPIERLRRLPYARLCIGCQSQRERGTAHLRPAI